jgi:cation-transporting ATPase E
VTTDVLPAGLSEAEAEERRRAGLGNGVRAGSSRSYVSILRTNLFTFFNNILFVIGVGLLALGRTNDAVVSVGLGLLNAVISSVQELRAKRTLDRLRLLHRSRSRVLRDGREREVDPEDVVQGDLLPVAPGDQVVVDGPVVGAGRVEVDESLLTGESDPVVKTAGDRLLSGTYCVSGSALQLAEAVGADSYASSLTAAARTWVPHRTPLQARIDLVVRAVMLLVALVSAAILLEAALEGLSLLRVVQTSAVLSGLVPYGLFFLVSVSYAVGAAALTRQGALVQQLNAVESLSNVDVVCTDKTGTLTTGRLTLQDVVPVGGADDEPDPAGLLGLLGDVAHSTTGGNATTAAVVAGLPGTALPVREEVPFSSARRWSAVALDRPGAEGAAGVFVLGAVDALLPALAGGSDRAALAAAVDERVRQGLRVLLFARAVDDRAGLGDDGGPRLPPLRPLALVVLGDELRPAVERTVADFRRRGVALKVVSGDDPRTVAALVARLGLHDDEPLTGARLEAMSPAEFDDAVVRGTVFGRIAPEQKERIVDALRRRGRYVAMIGDGVNDTRSLKKAHVGVAMQSGSSVTRDVADLVLLDDSFAALGPAQTTGQRIIAGISVSLHLFLARVVTALLAIVGVSILGIGFPYEPAQVGLTLFTVGVPTLLLTVWARPEPPDPRLLTRVARFVLPAGVVTAVFGVALYAGFYTLIRSGLNKGLIPERGVRDFEAFTGLTGSDTSFSTLAATGVAQTVLSMFTAVTAFLLILFLAPPTKLFTGWTGVDRDKRPALLAVGLLATFLVVLLTPVTADYFSLLRPGGPEIPVVTVSAVLWFFTLRTCWRHSVPERLLGLPRPARADRADAVTARR